MLLKIFRDHPEASRLLLSTTIVATIQLFFESKKEEIANYSQIEQENVGRQKTTDGECRFCFGGPEDGRLVSPCLCRGTIGLVHESCLKRWRETSDSHVTICEICRFEYIFWRPKWVRVGLSSMCFTSALASVVLMGELKARMLINCVDVYPPLTSGARCILGMPSLGLGEVGYWITGILPTTFQFLQDVVVWDFGVSLFMYPYSSLSIFYQVYQYWLYQFDLGERSMLNTVRRKLYNLLNPKDTLLDLCKQHMNAADFFIIGLNLYILKTRFDIVYKKLHRHASVVGERVLSFEEES